jgi:hypothetical protein
MARRDPAGVFSGWKVSLVFSVEKLWRKNRVVAKN